jgi:hypothetical protein
MPAGIVRTLKKIPTGYEYLDLSKYSERPLRTRFGSWALVPQGLKRYAEGKGLAEEWKDVLELVSTSDRHPSGDPQERALPLAAMILADRPMYGALIRPFPLVCEPINVIGVVFLFGAMAERLGFLVLRIQTEFPDCEALRVVGENRLQLVRIEFEHMSRNFFRHMHEPNDCDLIVCWEHNWPECPLPVLELKKELGKLLAACGGNKALPVMNTDSDRVIGKPKTLPRIDADKRGSGKTKPTTETQRHGEQPESGDRVIGKPKTLPRIDADKRGSERTTPKPLTTEGTEKGEIG